MWPTLAELPDLSRGVLYNSREVGRAWKRMSNTPGKRFFSTQLVHHAARRPLLLVLCTLRLSMRRSRRGGRRQSQNLTMDIRFFVPVDRVSFFASSQRQRRTVTGGELESQVRLVKSRLESRPRSPSTGAVQAVRDFLLCRNPTYKLLLSILSYGRGAHMAQEHRRRITGCDRTAPVPA